MQRLFLSPYMATKFVTQLTPMFVSHIGSRSLCKCRGNSKVAAAVASGYCHPSTPELTSLHLWSVWSVTSVERLRNEQVKLGVSVKEVNDRVILWIPNWFRDVERMGIDYITSNVMCMPKRGLFWTRFSHPRLPPQVGGA